MAAGRTRTTTLMDAFALDALSFSRWVLWVRPLSILDDDDDDILRVRLFRGSCARKRPNSRNTHTPHSSSLCSRNCAKSSFCAPKFKILSVSEKMTDPLSHTPAFDESDATSVLDAVHVAWFAGNPTRNSRTRWFAAGTRAVLRYTTNRFFIIARVHNSLSRS